MVNEMMMMSARHTHLVEQYFKGDHPMTIQALLGSN